jgi:hypothetical protein
MLRLVLLKIDTSGSIKVEEKCNINTAARTLNLTFGLLPHIVDFN